MPSSLTLPVYASRAQGASRRMQGRPHACQEGAEDPPRRYRGLGTRDAPAQDKRPNTKAGRDIYYAKPWQRVGDGRCGKKMRMRKKLKRGRKLQKHSGKRPQNCFF